MYYDPENYEWHKGEFCRKYKHPGGGFTKKPVKEQYCGRCGTRYTDVKKLNFVDRNYALCGYCTDWMVARYAAVGFELVDERLLSEYFKTRREKHELEKVAEVLA